MWTYDERRVVGNAAACAALLPVRILRHVATVVSRVIRRGVDARVFGSSDVGVEVG